MSEIANIKSDLLRIWEKAQEAFKKAGANADAVESLETAVEGLQTEIEGKQDTLTFDTAPTKNSTNPVTSGGVYTAINTNNENFCHVGLRYKNLGSEFTDAQKEAIANGDFSDLWNGDYWEIDNVTWRIVDNTDFQYNRGDNAFTKHGLIIMPDSLLVSPAANLVDTADDSGNGYGNSGYRATHKETCKDLIAAAFGSDYIGIHREQMSTARALGGATSWTWYDADVELPSEANIFGQSIFGLSTPGGSGGRNISTQYGQFALFRFAPQWICLRVNYWLRDIVSASEFAVVGSVGRSTYDAPSYQFNGLRPYFILIGDPT